MASTRPTRLRVPWEPASVGHRSALADWSATEARSASNVHPRSTPTNAAPTRPARNAPTLLARASGFRIVRSERPATGDTGAGVGRAPIRVSGLVGYGSPQREQGPSALHSHQRRSHPPREKCPNSPRSRVGLPYRPQRTSGDGVRVARRRLGPVDPPQLTRRLSNRRPARKLAARGLTALFYESQ